MRKSWDEYFMEIAEIVKTRSTCLRRQVGAVIVKDNREYGGGDDLYYPAALRHLCENAG